ncbi:hypothetical protein F5B21DRAFT_493704 [Xylaria acuta]|nr:hypothetical protein F5B21DRAFT_493704 [Xylaria acuta]
MIASTVSLVLHCLQATRTAKLFSLLCLASPALRRRYSCFAMSGDPRKTSKFTGGCSLSAWMEIQTMVEHHLSGIVAEASKGLIQSQGSKKYIQCV